MPFIDDHAVQYDCTHAADYFICSVQQCSHWGHVAQLVAAQCQHQQLTLSQVTASLEQLCHCTPVRSLDVQQRQQLDVTLDQLASAVLQHLPQLQHHQVGELLSMFQVLGHRPQAPWVRSILQHAGTELVHYTPAELALLLLTATQAVSRTTCAAALPMLQFTRSSPSAGPVVTILPPQPAADSSAVPAAGPTSSVSDESSSDSNSARRANTVVTSAWLQLFMTTFERYIACRTAHPQLQPQHLEAVMSCLAALRVVPDKFWLYLFVRQLSAQLPACQPAGIVRMLSALAGMGYKLPEHVISQIERQVGGSALASLRPAECIEVVKSVATLKHKPSEAWMQQLLAYVLRGSTHLSASAVVTLMVCTAALGIDLNPSWIDVLLLQARAALHMLSAPEHVGLIDALSQQHHRPGPVFMSTYMSQVQAHLPELSLGQQSVLIASLAVVGYKPAPTWMAAFMGQLAGQKVAAADAGELLKLLAALRRMQYVPTSKAAEQLEGLIDGIAVGLPYQLLQQLRGALADLQYKPYVAAATAAGTSNSTTGQSDKQPTPQRAAVPGQADKLATGGHQAAAVIAESAVPEPDSLHVAASSGQDLDTDALQVEQQQHQPMEQGASSAKVMENLELFA
eukprot:GHUV01020281.1.p1 GENE.GHUV01020281.1~~GHUV01020281.1.p1  ORF type:complete len:626 (+),score=224.99 GHUV01020281.1:769-2646(+)